MSPNDANGEPDALRQICRLAGVATHWWDIFGTNHQVAREDLEHVLDALGLDCSSDAAMREHASILEAERAAPPPLITAEIGEPVSIGLPPGRWRLELEHGGAVEGSCDGGGLRIQAPDQPGYHRLATGAHEITLAVAPAQCFTVAAALGRPNPSSWGLALQLYSLRRPGDGGVGDYRALADFAREAAAHGAQALAISPVHAQFSADPDRFSPYAPSSRVMLNALHIAAGHPGQVAQSLEPLDLVDWPAMARDKLSRLRAEFDQGAGTHSDFTAWRKRAGSALEGHVLFEALHAEIWGRDRSRWHWTSWPSIYASRDAAGIAEFSRTHANEIAFHAWLQFRANEELREAQLAARTAGMAIGLVSDLAVGADSGGSHCWSHQGECLRGLTIGAPPDLLQKQGQNWGITGFSARGLRRNGYRGFIEMLQAAMRHAGGVRIDHAMGIARLWIIPEGMTADHGTYLAFPEDDLRRLIKLESSRHRAIVLAEDLGTVPEGFQGRLQRDGIDGMRVLQFERNDDGFTAPSSWPRQASAMTSTHDLPPVAGWWSGHDIDERARVLGMGAEQQQREHTERAGDRALLWRAMQQSGVAKDAMPAAWDTDPVADCALAHTAHAGCELVMIPVEDALGLSEQPNLPGTTTEHPNWRRRLSEPVGTVLSEPKIQARLKRVDGIRNAL